MFWSHRVLVHPARPLATVGAAVAGVLARSRARRFAPFVAGLLASVVAACAGEKAATAPAVERVEVSPSRASVTAGETIRLAARAEDAAGNTVDGAEIRWVSDSPEIANVDWRGEVVGVSPGTASITAVVDGKRGNAYVTVEPYGLRVASVSPDPMVEGQTATITGQGFDPVASNNRVTVDGLPAAVTGATATGLTITVPTWDCRPARNAEVRVTTIASSRSGALTRTVRPAEYLALAVGGGGFARDPADFCLQFAPNVAAEAYLIGVQSVDESSSSVTSVTLTSESGAGAGGFVAPPPAPDPTAGLNAPPPLHATQVRDLEIDRAHRVGEARFREREQRFLEGRLRDLPAMRVRSREAAEIAGEPLRTGDVFDMRVPDWNSPCDRSIPIQVAVRVVGTRSVWLEDVANPAGGYTLADLQTMARLFDEQIYNGDVDYFGAPTDLDGNGRVLIVITKEVNRLALGPNVYLLGFTAVADLASRSACAGSNEGEVLYGRTPDATGALGYPLSRQDMLLRLPFNLAHELTHIIQYSHRLYRQISAPVLPSQWEKEGQATLAEEVIGHRVLGHTTGQNYGRDVVASAVANGAWYSNAFGFLSYYYGWRSDADKAPNAPEQCSWLEATNQGNAGPCRDVDLLPYGVGWLFLRWLSDQYGPGYSGGEKGLQHALVDAQAAGFAAIEGLVGEPIDVLLAEFAAMQYVDDRVSGAAPRFTLASWNLPNVMSRYGSPATLAPRERSFGTFADAATVRGASTAYFRISGSGRAGTSIRVRNPSGALLPPHMRVWVVRLQ